MNDIKVLKTITNLLWSTYAMIVTSLFPFIIKTLIVHYLGIEYSGVSGLFASTLQILNLADLGFANAIVYYLYEPVAKKNKKAIGEMLNLLRYTYRAIGIAMVLVGSVVAFFLPLFVKGNEYPAGLNIYLIYFIYLFSTASSYIGYGYLEALFRADLHMDIIAKIGGTSAGVMFVVQIIAIVYYRDYQFYALLLLLQPIVYNLAMKYYYHKKYSHYRCKGRVSKSFLREFKKRVLAMALCKVRNVTRNSFDSVVISAFMGLAILGRYQNYYLILVFTMGLLGTFREPIKDTLGNGFVFDSKDSNYSVIQQYTYVLYLIISIVDTAIICFMQSVIKIWMGKDNLLSYGTVVAFAFYFFVVALADIAVLLRDATGTWWDSRFIAITESVLNILLNIILVRKYGVNGVIFATIITIAFINVPFELFFIFKKFIPDKIRNYAFMNLREALIAACTVSVSFGLHNIFAINCDGIIPLLINAVIFLGGNCVLWLFLHFPDKNFKVVSVLLSIVKAKKK